MDKDTFLDIEELIVENKKHERLRLELFKTILHRCHMLIREKNRKRIKCMNYVLPFFIAGKPRFDLNVLRNYVVHHLEENGFLVRVVDMRTVYVSWDETDINLEKFRQKKAELYKEIDDMYLVPNGGGGNYSPPTVSFDTMAHRQQVQKDIKNAREQRFQAQAVRFGRPEVDFTSFMKRF